MMNAANRATSVTQEYIRCNWSVRVDTHTGDRRILVAFMKVI